MRSELYADRKNRDARFAELKAQGVIGLYRSSVRNQLLHPEYVKDADPVAQADNQLGNTRYKTYWAVLYEVGTREDRFS